MDPDFPDLPEELRDAGFASVRPLDVRPIVERGENPIGLILTAVDSLDPDEVLHLVVTFDPLPLYAVLGGRGFQSLTRVEEGVKHVWFYPAAGPKRRLA